MPDASDEAARRLIDRRNGGDACGLTPEATSRTLLKPTKKTGYPFVSTLDGPPSVGDEVRIVTCVGAR
jgi:hypothetical protein